MRRLLCDELSVLKLGIFAGTEDDAEWQVLFEFPLVLRQPAEAELHLDFAFGLEVALLQTTTTRRLSLRL